MVRCELSSIVSLIIPFKQNEPIHEMQLFYNESVIANKDVCKYLGVIIYSKLNYKAFINHVESKIAKSVNILSRLRYSFLSFALLLLYPSMWCEAIRSKKQRGVDGHVGHKGVFR